MSLPVVAFGPKDSYFIESPTAWGMNDLPVNLQSHFAPQSPVSLVYFMVLGANDSFFMSYRGVDGNDYMIHEGLPRSLDQWLSDKDENNYCTRNIPEITISLGPNGKSFFVTDGVEMGWSGLPKNLEEALETLRNPNGSWMTLPRYLSLGAHQTFVVLNHDNSGAWDLQGQYPYLQLHFDNLKASATSYGLRIFHNINAIYLNPFEAGYFVLTTIKGEAAWAVPHVVKDDADKVLSTLEKPSSPSQASTTTSSTPPASAGVASVQSVTKIGRAELQRVSSASNTPLVRPGTPQSQARQNPPVQPSPPPPQPQQQSQQQSKQQPTQKSIETPSRRPSREFQPVQDQSVESTKRLEKSSQDSSPTSQKQLQREAQPGQQQSPKSQHSRQRTTSKEIDKEQLDLATVRALASGRQLLVDIKSQMAQTEVQKAASAKTGRSTPDLSSTGGLVNRFEELNRPAQQPAALSQAVQDSNYRPQTVVPTRSGDAEDDSQRLNKDVDDSAANGYPPPPPPKPSKRAPKPSEYPPTSPPGVAPHRTFTNESTQSDLRQSFASNDSSKFVAISRHARQPDARMNSVASANNQQLDQLKTGRSAESPSAWPSRHEQPNDIRDGHLRTAQRWRARQNEN